MNVLRRTFQRNKALTLSSSIVDAALENPSHILLMSSSHLIAVAADYAAEIENAVGVEVYGPIFKAGIFIFISGIISSVVVAFIVTKSNSWEALEEEFTKGKEAQFIEMMGIVQKNHIRLFCRDPSFFFSGEPEDKTTTAPNIISQAESETILSVKGSEKNSPTNPSFADLSDLDI